MLKQTHTDMSLFNTTKRQRKDPTVVDLTANVNKLVDNALISPDTTENPSNNVPLLSDKDVEHTFENGQVYRGHVISVVPGYTSWYNIKYVDDQAVYTCQLRQDYMGGILKIDVPSSRYHMFNVKAVLSRFTTSVNIFFYSVQYKNPHTKKGITSMYVTGKISKICLLFCEQFYQHYFGKHISYSVS